MYGVEAVVNVQSKAVTVSTRHLRVHLVDTRDTLCYLEAIDQYIFGVIHDHTLSGFITQYIILWTTAEIIPSFNFRIICPFSILSIQIAHEPSKSVLSSSLCNEAISSAEQPTT